MSPPPPPAQERPEMGYRSDLQAVCQPFMPFSVQKSFSNFIVFCRKISFLRGLSLFCFPSLAFPRQFRGPEIKPPRWALLRKRCFLPLLQPSGVIPGIPGGYQFSGSISTWLQAQLLDRTLTVGLRTSRTAGRAALRILPKVSGAAGGMGRGNTVHPGLVLESRSGMEYQ